MRRVLAALGTVALAMAALTTSVAAAPPDRFSDTQTGLFCDGLTSEAGTVLVVAAVREAEGPFGDLAFWAAGSSPETSPPTWITAAAAVMLTDSVVTAQYELVEFVEPTNPEDPPFGDPVGTATLEATLTPAGDPEPYSFDFGSGNQQGRVEGVLQPMSVSGSLELPEDITYDLSSCTGFVDTFTVFVTNPAAFVNRSSSLQLSCFWETEDSFVSLFAGLDPFGAFADIFVSDPSGEYQGFTMGTLTETSFSATFDLFPAGGPGGEGEPVGSASADATVTDTGERINERFTFDNVKVHIFGRLFAVDGALELTTPDGTTSLPMDAEHCSAGDVTVVEMQSARQGPRGRPLPNDTPDAAEPIAIGDSVSVRTGGTALEAEAPCVIDEEFDVPFGHTAWWTFEGTGDPVTVTTAGSSFDTVLGIYVDDGGVLTQVGCVDDTEGSLQAEITLETVAGETYFIQAGGFASSSGDLVLAVLP
jgi:hypothetical protein